MQDANVALDVKKQILYSLNIRDLDGSAAEAKYSEVVKNETEKDGQKLYECQIDGKNTSTTKVRPLVWVLKSRTLRLGRRSSSASRSGTRTAT